MALFTSPENEMAELLTRMELTSLEIRLTGFTINRSKTKLMTVRCTERLWHRGWSNSNTWVHSSITKAAITEILRRTCKAKTAMIQLNKIWWDRNICIAVRHYWGLWLRVISFSLTIFVHQLWSSAWWRAMAVEVLKFSDTWSDDRLKLRRWCLFFVYLHGGGDPRYTQHTT